MVDAFKGLTDKVGVVGQFVRDKQKQKDYDQWARNQRYNSAAVVPVNRSGNHGNWSVTGSSYGAFRQPEQGFTNEGRYMNNPGMKIRAFGGAIEEALEMPVEYVDVDKLMQDKPVQQPIEQPMEQTEAAPVENQNSSISSGAFAMPLSTIKITSGFGSRKAPLKGASTDHNGIDLYAPINTPVFSPMDGVVEKVYYNDLGGKQLIIRHSDGSRSGFAHLNDYGVAVGDKIAKGQRVALSGNTGNSTGAHLHFTFRTPDGNPVDPSVFFNMNGITDTDNSSSTISHMDHNNPGNIHFGEFTSKYGATKGRKDGDGYVAIFPDAMTGLKAMDDLLFNPKGIYYNKTIADARNTYVGIPNESSRAIASAMGGNKRLADLTPEERKKLKQEFAKWEDRNVYNAYRKNGYFETGGTVGGTVTCSNCGHSWSTESSDPSDVTTCHNCGFTNNTIDNNMKIRITGGPKQMAYGGQSGYGFDLGQRNTYSAMSQNPYEESSRTLGPVDREDANIEAEKGETVYGDLNNDGHNEHMIIGGKRHTQGGTPLNVPEGSFIFSDTKKMKIKDPEVLSYFGLKPRKDGYTPAEIAKRYDINKYKAILQDPLADAIRKRTAQLMMESYEKKLGYLALIQESMKGFPQGIPKIAEEVMGGGQQGGQQMPQPGGEEPQQQQGPQEEMAEGPEGQEAPDQEMMEGQSPMGRWGGSYGYGGAPMFPDGGEPCYDAQGNVIPCEDKRLSELGSDAYTRMQPVYDTVFEAANKYKNPETGMVSPFNSLRAQLKGMVKHPEFLFMKKYDLPNQEADPYHTGKYTVDRPGNSTMTWWPDKYAQPRRERTGNDGSWWQEHVKNPYQNWNDQRKINRGIRRQGSCASGNCTEQEMQDQAMYGGMYEDGGYYIPQDYGQMAYGGYLPYADEGMQVETKEQEEARKKKKVKTKDRGDVEAEVYGKGSIPTGYVPYPGSSDLWWIPGKPGSVKKGSWHEGRVVKGRGKNWNVKGCENLLYTVADMKARPGCYKTFLEKEGWKNASPEEQQDALNRMKQGRHTVFTPDIQDPGTDPLYATIEEEPRVEKPVPKFMCNPSGEGVMAIDPYTPVPPGAVTYNTREEAEKVCKSTTKKEPRYICEDNVIKTLPEGSNTVGYKTVEEAQASCTPIKKRRQPGFGMPPMFNAAAAVGPKKYHPWAAKLEQYMPNPAFLSPERELAENAGLATSMTRGFTGSPQQYLAMANAAQQGAIGNAGNIIGKISNQNVGIANQFSPLQAGIMNDMMKYDANRQDVLHQNENMYDKEYRNSLRSYLHNYVDVPNKAAYEYVTKRNIMNASNPYYNLTDGPGGGNLMLKPGTNAYSTVTGRASGSTAGIDANTKNKYMARIAELKAGGLDSKQMAPILNSEFPSMSSNSRSASRTNSRQAAANQYMNMFPGAGYQYPANYEEDDSDYGA